MHWPADVTVHAVIACKALGADRMVITTAFAAAEMPDIPGKAAAGKQPSPCKPKRALISTLPDLAAGQETHAARADALFAPWC
jgi:hypothetical protein